MKTLKSIVAVTFMPVFLMYCFQVNVIKTGTPSRAPAIEKSVKKEHSLKKAIHGYILAVNGIN